MKLRAAIRENKLFDNVTFEGSDSDYKITLVVKTKDKEEALKQLNDVRDFALTWGSLPVNQVWFHPDDGFDERGNRKYKRVVENSVKLLENG